MSGSDLPPPGPAELIETGDDGEELRRLRRELVTRFKAHPPSTWSRRLLAVVVGAIDLQFGDPGDGPGIDPGGRPRLRIVR